ncbi:hypothetical protein L3C95_17960 [Chitinophaga filiformis]|uniref:DUF6934 family protein n=1 Tax=Chitinophaga filiformis TaxID=104663 RepID=UPI001F2C3E45|nr:hypothetical protein [Chitinophaga filiformis]MCF6404789.1 hypothetical protein [Chitinophaga filiformis]
MANAVKINFDDVYDINMVSNEMTLASFETELTDGSKKKLLVEISPNAHELMPNVYNLAFGPSDTNGEIDDKAQIKHKDYSKVFSTILLHAQIYLTDHPDHYLGIDGSSNSRAWLYYRFILSNFDYLSTYFEMRAMKYYVRITRFGKYQYENPFDFKDIKSDFVRITRDSPWHPEFMYNYFIFSNKDQLN